MKSLPNTSPNILGNELWTEKKGYWEEKEELIFTDEFSAIMGVAVPVFRTEIKRVWKEETSKPFVF